MAVADTAEAQAALADTAGPKQVLLAATPGVATGLDEAAVAFDRLAAAAMPCREAQSA
ncbi:MAG: hypothetical protein MUF16_03600 [Burkholderiaceae bacterium]|jgi:hypothetical protein|nr:hypothetical protein [Burkholderiaceae bacterium]